MNNREGRVAHLKNAGFAGGKEPPQTGFRGVIQRFWGGRNRLAKGEENIQEEKIDPHPFHIIR